MKPPFDISHVSGQAFTWLTIVLVIAAFNTVLFNTMSSIFGLGEISYLQSVWITLYVLFWADAIKFVGRI